MAKAGFVLHGARGKVGNLVARKGENKTILAEYQPIVKNPQTNAQMAQRIILSTVAQAIPLLYPIIDHSFEGFAVGSKCTREFRRLNMSLLRQYAAIDFRDTPKAVDASVFMTTKGIKALIPNKYQISSGSLAAPKIEIVRPASPSPHLVPKLPNFKVPYVKDGTDYKMKLGDLLTGMFGLTTPGEQLTFVVIQRAGEGFKYVFNGDDTMPGWVVPYTSMRAARLVISPSVDFNTEVVVEIDGQSVDYSDFKNAIISAFSSSAKTDSSLLAWLDGTIEDSLSTESFSPVGGTNEMLITWGDGFYNIDEWCALSTHLGHAYALGIIRSKLLDNGQWAYSNSFMTLARLSGTDWENYGLDWNSAIQAWFEKNAITDNSLFLKEGATANELGESFT